MYLFFEFGASLKILNSAQYISQKVLFRLFMFLNLLMVITFNKKIMVCITSL